MERIIHFLMDLNENNNREWFNKNRGRYEESRAKMLFYTEIFNNEISKFDDGIPIMNPKDCLFRIFRDVRFSKDKRPYKTNMGSFIAKGGRKSTRAGYYFHVEPGMCFVGGGVYMPQPGPLKAVRTAIYENPEEFLDIIQEQKFKSYYPGIYGDSLKTAPKGFPKDFKYIELIRNKSFAFTHKMEDEVVTGERFVEYVVEAFKELYKVNRFLNDALEVI